MIEKTTVYDLALVVFILTIVSEFIKYQYNKNKRLNSENVEKSKAAVFTVVDVFCVLWFIYLSLR
jgi:hypothetical protein